MTAAEHRQHMRDRGIAHITDRAEARMRERTARERHAAALEALKGPDEIPDNDDASLQGYWPAGERPCSR
jgi:hypothetical protein